MSKERPIIMSSESVRSILDGRKTQTRRVCKTSFDFETNTGKILPCPYGKVGDRLWVKEAYFSEAYLIYKADQSQTIKNTYRWKSPRFMPHGACRITLEITAVRCERLQDVTEADVVAEGLGVGKKQVPFIGNFRYEWIKHWDSNPYVWVIEFKRVEESK